MNGLPPRIEIFKPFGEAWELMKTILFRPFEFRKWLVMGFAAFLASFSGGFQTSFNPIGNYSSHKDNREIAEAFNDFDIHQIEWWWIAVIVAIVLFCIALGIVLLWIGARGRFIFMDSIVKNREAIVAPWKEFRVEGNSFFLFSLLFAVVFVVVVLLAALPLLLPVILHHDTSKPGLWFWIGLGLFMFFILSISIGWAFISHFMTPIMYRQRCRARRAFSQTVSLIMEHPGPMLLYFLFLFVITIGAVILGCAVMCVTCCIAAIPYIGTVVLLPIPVTFYAFSMLFLRQFGPDYDAWQVIPQPEPLTISSPPPLPGQPPPPPVQS